MAISHADHHHPNTPAARAACRKQLANGDTPLVGNPIPNSLEGVLTKALNVVPRKAPGEFGPWGPEGVPSSPEMTVVPRKRGDGGVVKGMKATEPKAATRRLKVTGTVIRRLGDLADVPAVLATEVRRAWALDWTVQVGHPFNDDERRIVITGPVAEIALVWDSNGRTAVFIRNHNSSITYRVDTADEAFDDADNADAWDENGNYIQL